MDSAPTAGLVVRLLRALVLAVVAMVIGFVAHVGADGAVPGPAALAGLLAASTAGAAPFLGRQASTARVIGLLVFWQATLHAALTALAGHREPVGEPASGIGVATAPGWMEHLLADLSVPHLLMAVTHALAAAAVGWWLASGERALWTLVALGSRSVATAVAGTLCSGRWLDLVAMVGGARRRVAVVLTDDVTRPAVVRLSQVLTRRGPPQLRYEPVSC